MTVTSPFTPEVSFADPPFACPPDGLVLHLPFPPSVNSMFKNAKRGRVCTDEYNAWKDDAGYKLNRQHPKPIIGRVKITIDLDNRRQGDCSNRAKAVEDLLVAHGVIADDSKAYVQRTSIGWEDVEECRVRIEGVE